MPVRAALLASAVASALAVAQPVLAQDSGDGFRFQRPSGSWSLRGGLAMPSAGSDVFSYTTNTFTVNRGDFSAIDFGADLAFTITPRLDLVLDVSHSGASRGSEYRNFVDNNQLPIQQTTTFQRTPLTVSARYYLSERGRQIGHYAWVPNRIVPYVGAGIGAMNYGFDQKGDFVDTSNLAVLPDELHSSGWAPMAQLFAGAEWSMGPGWALRTEARYVSANAALSGDFVGFHHIDLSGVTTNVGFFVRF
jgi:opacity protein-like surface antigen